MNIELGTNHDKYYARIRYGNIPPRSGPSPRWYFDAMTLRKISKCAISVIDGANNTIDEVNFYSGLVAGASSKGATIIMGGKKPNGFTSLRPAFHLNGAKKGEIKIDLYCPNATEGNQWSHANIWKKGKGFFTLLQDPITVCPHPLKHNNFSVVTG